MRNILFLCLMFTRTAWANPNQEIESLVKTHVQQTNDENLSGVLATLDSKCPDYPQQAAMMPKLFEQFDLTYSLEQLNILSTEDKTATIAITLCTEKRSGPAFRDNRIQQLITINKTDDGWKLCAGKIMNIQYLDADPKYAQAFGGDSLKCKAPL